MADYLNLWIFYVAGYAIVYPIRIWADKKRGEPFEDPELSSQPKVLIPALIWIIAGLVISIFTPISTGTSLYLGIGCAILGVIIVVLSFYSFASSSGLNTTKIHRYSRNPNYIGWNIFIGGLTWIGWSSSFWSFLFLFFFLYTIIYLHMTILLEEKFLAGKYGESYEKYLRQTSRYFRMRRYSG